jgi:hypothetical protein
MKKYLLIILLIGLWSCVDEETDNSINFSASVDFSELETIINVAYCPIEISATRGDNFIPNLRFWVRGNLWYQFGGGMVVQDLGYCHVEVEYPPIADDCVCIDDGNQNTSSDEDCDCFFDRINSWGNSPNTPISEDEFLELWNLSSLEKIGNDCYSGSHWANNGDMALQFYDTNITDENGIYSQNLSIGKSMVGRTLKIEIFWYDDEKEEMDSQIIDIPIVNAN